MHSKDLGLFIKKFGLNQSVFFIKMACALILFLIGIFISVLVGFSIDPSYLLFIPSRLLFVITGLCFCITALAIFSKLYYLHKQCPMISLYEYGLCIHDKKHEIYCAFNEIQDIFDDMEGQNGTSRGLCFRSGIYSSWYHITHHISQYYRLRNEIIRRHIDQRGHLLLEHLGAGGCVGFHKIPNAIYCEKTFKIYKNIAFLPLENIKLTADLLVIGKTRILIESIGNIYENTMLDGHAKIVDRNNHTLYVTYLSSILSAPLLYFLITQLQQCVKEKTQKLNKAFNPIQQYNTYINNNMSKDRTIL